MGKFGDDWKGTREFVERTLIYHNNQRSVIRYFPAGSGCLTDNVARLSDDNIRTLKIKKRAILF